MNPAPFTMRELIIMAEGRGRMEWNQTSSLMAIVANIMRDPKKSKAIEPEMFNPYEVHKKKKNIPVVPLSVLKDIFVKDKN